MGGLWLFCGRVWLWVGLWLFVAVGFLVVVFACVVVFCCVFWLCCVCADLASDGNHKTVDCCFFPLMIGAILMHFQTDNIEELWKEQIISNS